MTLSIVESIELTDEEKRELFTRDLSLVYIAGWMCPQCKTKGVCYWVEVSYSGCTNCEWNDAIETEDEDDDW